VQLIDIDVAGDARAKELLASVAGSVLASARLAAKGRVRGLESGDELAGCVVTSTRDDGALVIEAIAVAPDCRGQGLGRAIVEMVRDGHEHVVAEAAEDAVGFFRSCGFAVSSAGGTPYKRRYICALG
jgi:ribosomal protein S18 acetylase RimI-like enzyme